MASWRSVVAVVLDTSSCLPERRLAVWQDIVCDTFVGLDCQSDMRESVLGLGFAIHDRTGGVHAGRFLCAAGVPHAVADRARQRGFRAGGARQQRRERRLPGRPRSRRVRRTIRHLRHHPPLRVALRRQLFADDLSDAAKAAATARRLVRWFDRDDVRRRSSARTTGL